MNSIQTGHYIIEVNKKSLWEQPEYKQKVLIREADKQQE